MRRGRVPVMRGRRRCRRGCRRGGCRRRARGRWGRRRRGRRRPADELRRRWIDDRAGIRSAGRSGAAAGATPGAADGGVDSRDELVSGQENDLSQGQAPRRRLAERLLEELDAVRGPRLPDVIDRDAPGVEPQAREVAVELQHVVAGSDRGSEVPVGRRGAIHQHHRLPIDLEQRAARIDHLANAGEPGDGAAQPVIDRLGIAVAEGPGLGVGGHQVAPLDRRSAGGGRRRRRAGRRGGRPAVDHEHDNDRDADGQGRTGQQTLPAPGIGDQAEMRSAHCRCDVLRRVQ